MSTSVFRDHAEDAAFEEAKAGFDKLLASFEDLGKE